MMNPATVGIGLQALAQMAAAGGNSLDLSQGHKELAVSQRRPLRPGKSSEIDHISPPQWVGAQMNTPHQGAY